MSRPALLVGAHGGHALGAALLPDGEQHHGRVNRKIVEAITLICGWHRDPRGPQMNSGEGDRGAGDEVRDHEVVDREREGQEGGGPHPGHDQRQGDQAEGRGWPQVLRRLLQAAVEAIRRERTVTITNDRLNITWRAGWW